MEKISIVIGVLGLVVGISGVLVGVYQGFEKKKIERYRRSHSWYLYNKTNNAVGILQEAIKFYKGAYQNNLNIDVIEKLSICDALGQELFKESIRYIQIAEPKFDKSTIED